MPETVKCNKCGIVLNETSDTQPDKRVPCPSCGSTSRLFAHTAIVTVGLVVGANMKGKHAGAKKPFIEQSSGKDFWRDMGKFVDRIMVIDREHDLYQEIVKDPINDIIIRYCLEPLSKHRGHGSAKKKT
jgi:DNA-directed RNA polymerase subunit RPC12/RpoP